MAAFRKPEEESVNNLDLEPVVRAHVARDGHWDGASRRLNIRSELDRERRVRHIVYNEKIEGARV